MFETLKTLVLQTVTVTGVKLATPADRIGLGLGVAIYPTDNLSPGQIPMPHNPEPEQVRSRQLSSMPPRMWLQTGNAVPPAGHGTPGCAPGFSAVQFASSCAFPFEGWQRTTRTAVEGRTRTSPSTSAVRRSTVTSQADFPGDLRHDDRLGCDCQSLRRLSGKRIAKREVCLDATVRK